MAVGERGEFGQHFPPPVAVGGTPHGQFDRGFATGSAPHRRPPKQLPTQGVQFTLFQLAKSPLQGHTQVVGSNRQMMQRLVAPEAVHAQPFDPELSAQFFDRVFQVRPPVVAPPHRHGVHTGRQVSDQGLKPISFQFQQRLAAGLRTVFHPLHAAAAGRRTAPPGQSWRGKNAFAKAPSRCSAGLQRLGKSSR